MWLKIDEGFPVHPKTIRFCALMQTSSAIGYLVRLWAWACRAAPDGDLSEMTPGEVEYAMGWAAMDGRCYEACVKAGFIDDDGQGRRIHNWETRTGGDILDMQERAEAKRAADRERQRRHRDRAKGGDATVTNAPVTPPSRVTDRDETLRNAPKTSQAKTDKTSENRAPAHDPGTTEQGQDATRTPSRALAILGRALEDVTEGRRAGHVLPGTKALDEAVERLAPEDWDLLPEASRLFWRAVSDGEIGFDDPRHAQSSAFPVAAFAKAIGEFLDRARKAPGIRQRASPVRAKSLSDREIDVRSLPR